MIDDFEKNASKEYWERVKQLSKKNGLTQLELCQRTGIDIGKFKSQVTNIVAPKVFDSQKIAECLGVSVEYLVTGKEKDSYKGKYENLKSVIQNAINEN